MNLVLIGYRGTGKSAVGELLAERLGMRYVSMDREITLKAKMSIPEIVEKYGWKTFRDQESELANELSSQDGLVIDTGGGVIERQENVEALQVNSQIFWLHASVNTITSRIQGDSSRPALTSGKTFVEEVAEVLAKREPLYKAAAHHEIDTNYASPGEIADTIITLWTHAKQGLTAE
ncbi:MAG: shikimate kinase [Pelobacteraceae bacterium]